MLGTKTSETFSQNNKTDLELLDPLYEVNESLGNEEASEKELSEDAFPEISPRIFGLFNIKDPLTCEGLNNAIYELGVINLCWPDIQDPVFETRTCFPKSYYTNNGKERLLLAYAENFRRQFIFKRTTHKALLLQAPNECGLQKMVCTTIRPTKLCYRGMNTWEGCASLVADFFNYEPLLKPMLLPERIASPFTCLVRRSGNSFELATVLVSYLIGSGFDAYVVVGYSRRDTTLGLRFRTECPDIPDESEVVEEEHPPEQEPRYKLAVLPDLRSKFVITMEEKAEQKRQDELDKIEAERQLEIAELEKPPHDAVDGWRIHAWVLVLPPLMGVEEAFFIEPSEGNRYPLSTTKYQAVHTVYNNENYYVNIQDCYDLPSIEYDLFNLEHWEHLLAGEPFHYRVLPGMDNSDPSTAVETEKHLDMPPSWVEKLDISMDEFERRYPGNHKVIHYKKVLVDKYSPYFQRDGIVKRVKVFDDYELTVPVVEYCWYENRADKMLTAKIDYVKQEIKETFKTGREDFFKVHTYALSSAPGCIEAYRTMEFYYYARLDHLTKIVTTPLTFDEYYTDRDDRLETRFIVYTEGNKHEPKRQLKKITEVYSRNPDVPAIEDIRVKIFSIPENTIDLVYHYAYNFVTMSTRNYIKPNLAETGGRILFDPTMTSGYIADPNEKLPRPLNVYYTLCDNMEWENMTRKHIRDYEADVASYLRVRHQELTEPALTVYLFDTERNEKAKKGWKEQEAQKQEMTERETEAEMDPLTPYLARMFGAGWSKDAPLSLKAATILREQCVTDFKAKQLARQNLVQARFDKLNSEYKSKRLWYLANQFILSQEKEAAYFESSAQLAFQVHTVEVRLVRHRDLSVPRARLLEDMLDKHVLLREYTRARHYYHHQGTRM